MHCYPLPEGTFTVDISKTFIPFDAAVDDIKSRPASLLVDIVPFLIKTKTDLIVIDPGLGFQLPNGEWQIHHNIKQCGYDATEVTKVLLSHMHKDHCGGTAFFENEKWNLMFPNASYYCPQGDMEIALSKGGASFETEKLRFLLSQKNLIMLQGNGNISSNIQFETIGGHTPYHLAFTIAEDNTKYFYAGDVLPQPQQLIRKFVAKYDYDGKAAAAKRIEIGNAAANDGRICLYFHSASMPMSTVVKDEEGRPLPLPLSKGVEK